MQSKTLTKRKSENSSPVIELNYDFDGNLSVLLAQIRMGRVFSFNGKPLPIADCKMAGSVLLVEFPHRTLQVDLTSAIAKAKRGIVKLNMHFER